MPSRLSSAHVGVWYVARNQVRSDGRSTPMSARTTSAPVGSSGASGSTSPYGSFADSGRGRRTVVTSSPSLVDSVERALRYLDAGRAQLQQVQRGLLARSRANGGTAVDVHDERHVGRLVASEHVDVRVVALAAVAHVVSPCSSHAFRTAMACSNVALSIRYRTTRARCATSSGCASHSTTT